MTENLQAYSYGRNVHGVLQYFDSFLLMWKRNNYLSGLPSAGVKSRGRVSGTVRRPEGFLSVLSQSQELIAVITQLGKWECGIICRDHPSN